MSTQADVPAFARGLEGVVAAATKIGEVDGKQGRLILRGYDIQELFGRASFEEAAYLLWNGRLPNRAEHRVLLEEMRRAREIPEPALAALRDLAPHAASPPAFRRNREPPRLLRDARAPHLHSLSSR